MLVGLGSGSTSAIAVEEIGERIRRRELSIEAVCTSKRTEEIARRAGIPVRPLTARVIDLYIDGADQVDAQGRMIKGGGGALLREKMVAGNSRRHVIVVDESKPVTNLGVGFPVPVDIVPFGVDHLIDRIRKASGGHPVLRRNAGASDPRLSDDGNLIVDCHFEHGIEQPEEVAARIRDIVGVVEVGLFFGLCDTLIVGHDDGVETRDFTATSRSAP